MLAKLIRAHKQMKYEAASVGGLVFWGTFASLRLPRPSQFCELASLVGKAGLGEIAPKPRPWQHHVHLEAASGLMILEC